MFRKKSRCKSMGELTSVATASGFRATLARSKSVPLRPRVKGILKLTTVDESLHKKYGETKEEATTESTSDSGDRRIEFKDIEIREYARTVGDNPSCSSGPPISIAWEYDPETTVLSLDQYEELRPPRRTHFEMILPRAVRHKMLRQEWHVTQQQIAGAVRTNVKVKNQRRTTVQNLDKADKFEEWMEKAGRKFTRSLLLRKSTEKQVQELERQMDAARVARCQQQVDQMRNDEDDNDQENDYGGGTAAMEDDDEEEDEERDNLHAERTEL